MSLQARICLAMGVLALPMVLSGASLRLGAMGDSLTDEYWDSGVANYASNWVSQLVIFRGVDMGSTASQAGTTNWGTPRGAGYKYNWALSGDNSATLLTHGQHTGLAAQASSYGVNTAVLAIGSNDFNPQSTSAYSGIYFGTWTSAQTQTYINQSLTNIEKALVTVKAAGMSVVMANLLDPGETPAVYTSFLFTDATKRDRVAAAVRSINAGLKVLAQRYQVPLMDWYALETAILGPNTNLHSTVKIGNVVMNLHGSDSGPPNATPTNAFVSDSFHPNTSMQGIFANVVLQALNSGYDAGLALFSEAEILSHAQIPYGGSDSLLSQIGSYANYVILPVLPRMTAINVTRTNLLLRFSSVSNQLYLVETRDSLITGTWSTMATNVPGTGGIVSLTNQFSAAVAQRFYRVRQLP